MRYTSAEYRKAQRILWDDAGSWAADTFAELNRDYFGGQVPARGIAWGLTPHGHALGYTAPLSGRITLHPALLDPRSDAWGVSEYLGEGYARDVLLHEMVHALLIDRGFHRDDEEGSHNIPAWCHQVERLAPLLGLGTVLAAPVKPRRIDGKVTRLALPGHLDRGTISGFPHTLRPRSWYEANRDRMRISL
jgi:hypothetical protein